MLKSPCMRCLSGIEIERPRLILLPWPQLCALDVANPELHVVQDAERFPIAGLDYILEMAQIFLNSNFNFC